jgi:hypothetical protein
VDVPVVLAAEVTLVVAVDVPVVVAVVLGNVVVVVVVPVVLVVLSLHATAASTPPLSSSDGWLATLNNGHSSTTTVK